MGKIDLLLYNTGRMGSWIERMEEETKRRLLAEEERRREDEKRDEAALAQRREAYEKRVEIHRLYNVEHNVEQKLKEIRDQVWQLGDLHIEVSSSSDFRSDKVFSTLSFYLNFEVDDHEFADMGGTGGMESYVPNYQRVDFRQEKIFFTGIRVDISSHSLVIMEAAYVMTPTRNGPTRHGQLDMDIIIGRSRGEISNEFYLYGFEPEAVRIGLEQPDLDSAFDKVLLESCLRRKEKGLVPIDVTRILGKNLLSIKTGGRKLLPPFMTNYTAFY